MSLPLDISTPEIEGVYQASKYRKLSLFVSGEEMEELFGFLGEVFLFDGSRPVEEGQGEIRREAFLAAYTDYARGIERGQLVDEVPLRPFFSAMLTDDRSALYAFSVAGGRFLIKPRRPVIQLQRHHFVRADKFHSGVMGKGSITWGISFSYPHLSIEPKTNAIVKVARHPVFDQIARWVRSSTRPTPILADGVKTNLPLRLGKKCYGWINQHPQLLANGLEVECGNCK